MYKVNLIRGWQSAQVLRQLRTRFILLMAIVSSILLLIYLGLFARFLILQQELSQLASRHYVSKAGYQYSTEELTKTLYGLKKLDQIKTIYLDYPEYAMYHRFILDRVFLFDSFTIDNYSLSKDHMVDMTLLTSNIEDIYSLISLLESDEVIKYFSTLEISSITSVKEKNLETMNYKIQVKLKFNDKLLNEKT